jgi:hypothetical protein
MGQAQLSLFVYLFLYESSLVYYYSPQESNLLRPYTPWPTEPPYSNNLILAGGKGILTKQSETLYSPLQTLSTLSQLSLNSLNVLLHGHSGEDVGSGVPVMASGEPLGSG